MTLPRSCRLWNLYLEARKVDPARAQRLFDLHHRCQRVETAYAARHRVCTAKDPGASTPAEGV